MILYGICHTGLLTACKQDQDGTAVPFWSPSQAVSKPVWHIPLLCVQWKTPDDGQSDCPKHVEFHSKNKFEKLMHLVGFIIRKNNLSHGIYTYISLKWFLLFRFYNKNNVCIYCLFCICCPCKDMPMRITFLILEFVWQSDLNKMFGLNYQFWTNRFFLALHSLCHTVESIQ